MPLKQVKVDYSKGPKKAKVRFLMKGRLGLLLCANSG